MVLSLPVVFVFLCVGLNTRLLCLQGEIQRLRDTLAISERTVKAETQLRVGEMILK